MLVASRPRCESSSRGRGSSATCSVTVVVTSLTVSCPEARASPEPVSRTSVLSNTWRDNERYRRNRDCRAAIHRSMAGRDTFRTDSDLDGPRFGRSSRKNDPALNGFKTTGHGQDDPAAPSGRAYSLPRWAIGRRHGRRRDDEQREAETDDVEHAAHKLWSTFACPDRSGRQ